LFYNNFSIVATLQLGSLHYRKSTENK